MGMMQKTVPGISLEQNKTYIVGENFNTPFEWQLFQIVSWSKITILEIMDCNVMWLLEQEDNGWVELPFTKAVLEGYVGLHVDNTKQSVKLQLSE